MIATQQRDPIWPLGLQQQQVRQRLKRVVAAVDLNDWLFDMKKCNKNKPKSPMKI